MRRAFLNKVSEMIKSEPDTVFFTVDIGMWALRDVLENCPERCMNVGIFEDGMISIAAGMASRGLIPTVFGIQPYLVERTLEQVKMDLAYQKFGVNIVGTGAAVDYSKYGYSHYCAEDVGVVKQIPGCEFVAPGSAKQFLQLFEQSYRDGHTTFFRISDHPNSVYDPDVFFGKATVIKKGTRVTVIVVSIMLDEVMEVCKDEDVTVLYYTTLEPFDYETLANNCESGRILIVEPEFEGSLLYDVHHALSYRAIVIDSVAFPREIFRNYGTYEDKLRHYGLNDKNIRERLHSLMRADGL